ncbi:MAG: GAF domain-containing protein [Clostridiales bacterium]|jgi:GAF domain-containing protein|nr:GAF domain-containing protein [Clostridiales bacterium]
MIELKRNEEIAENYRLLGAAITEHLADEPDLIANLANISSMIRYSLPHVNWAGFYLLQGDTLVLGPFCGKPACTRITLDRGVVGYTARKGEIVIVPNVHEFDGYITCDPATNSQMVSPLYKNGELFGVLDLDSPVFDRFTQDDAAGLAEIVKSIHEFLERC